MSNIRRLAWRVWHPFIHRPHGQLHNVSRHSYMLQVRCMSSTDGSTISGKASPTATKEFVTSKSMPSTRMARGGGLHISRVGFGSDDYGVDTSERSQQLAKAVLRRGVNVLQIDIDSLFARRQPTSPLYETSEAALHWEKRTLQRLICPKQTKKDTVRRDQLVIIGRIGVLGANPYTSPYGVEVVNDRVQEALNLLGLEQFDLVLTDLPVRSRYSVESLSKRVLQCLEESVDKGLTQYYGIGASQFTPFDEHEGWGDAIPIRTIFAVAEDYSAKHHLVAIEYVQSVLDVSSMLPTAIDENEESWSLMELIRSYGMTQLLRSPLDCLHEGKVFRCVDSESHDDVSGPDVSHELDEAVNVAIHLERKFEFEVLPELRKESSDNTDLRNIETSDYNWARTVGFNLHQLDSLLQWRFMWNRRVKPAVNKLTKISSEMHEASQWSRAYQGAMFHMKLAIDKYVDKLHAHRAHAVSQEFETLDGRFYTVPQLDWRVLRLLLSSPGDTVLTEEAQTFNKGLNQYLPPASNAVKFQNELGSLVERIHDRMWPAQRASQRPTSRTRESGNSHPVADKLYREDSYSEAGSHADRMRRIIDKKKQKNRHDTGGSDE
eukprot:gb/GECG01015214.1/.p1 GENE.gb/GECG01015214.1/~~gb/GECG01015214.1/.p1  ORF type:complete len:605 (+),score=78.49 gb/GECG01015214.1/:1-1815(+)